MSNPNKNSTANGALWVIAFSLAVIATCLVVLVTRQQNRAAQMETVELTPSTEAAPPQHQTSLPKQLSVRHADFSKPAPAPAIEPPLPAAEAARQTEIGTATTVPEPKVSSGFAPLTTLLPTASTASIAGRVMLKGTPPPENRIDFGPQCGTLHKDTTNTTRFYEIAEDGGLANVFVFIKSGLKGKHFSTPNQPVTLNQVGCLYEPYVFGLMTGQRLQIKNSDLFLHNVHASPAVEGNRAFNQAEMYDAVITKTFAKPELPLKLSCDVHPWMIAYACVVDNPFFAVTDAKGNYAISNVPPGNYVLEAFHRKTHGFRDGVTEKIAVTAGETTTADFTIELPPSFGAIARGR